MEENKEIDGFTKDLFGIERYNWILNISLKSKMNQKFSKRSKDREIYVDWIKNFMRGLNVDFKEVTRRDTTESLIVEFETTNIAAGPIMDKLPVYNQKDEASSSGYGGVNPGLCFTSVRSITLEQYIKKEQAGAKILVWEDGKFHTSPYIWFEYQTSYTIQTIEPNEFKPSKTLVERYAATSKVNPKYYQKMQVPKNRFSQPRKRF